MIEFITSGVYTTVQDLGRSGFYHLGVPPSGAADRYSFQIGNMLVGNPVSYAGLEFRMLGPTLLFHKRAIIAIVGAPVDCFVNGISVPMWQSLEVKAGDQVSFSFAQQGVCTYMCIAGGIQLSETLHSRSTYMVNKNEKFGGYKAVAGGTLQFGESAEGLGFYVEKSIPEKYWPSFEKEQHINMVMGLGVYRISDEGVRNFLDAEWEVGTESSRVAYRLQGGPVPFEDSPPSFGAGSRSSNIVDIAYPVGVIIVPNPEEIIIMMNDATTGGGFVTIGAVISSDLDLLNQCRPQTKVRFCAVTLEQSLMLRREKQQRLAAVAKYLEVVI
ncbi:biotin-dependent carboxylase-like uncharacterized protein [Aneurinibacillus soli]|uniref:KipI antagonist n=1 Tax=Aneurinibacillus soli TaxID=1500254 RepID=A0A0U4NCJ1_9BACL|nr:biotin-dependent carboxyltransferase family protein [Aneurinibacillus soli]PYE58795.1 biotin-dependent carboxylase-like uncharacterized protein [Aneurinibacillus soli]BAU26660.1 KipI antagonist [Aneurinibacillus soli]